MKNTPITQLLDENNTDPIEATKRLKRMNTVRAQKFRRDAKNPMDTLFFNSSEQTEAK